MRMFKKLPLTQISKRKKFVATSIILSLGFVVISLLDGSMRFWGIAALVLFTITLFYWSLFEAVSKDATLLLLILPALFTLGVGLFWFLLPSTIVTLLPILVLYGVGIYALSSTSNIFAVSVAIKKIALSRAAKGVGFVLTLFTSFLLYDAILSLKLSIAPTAILVALASFTLFLQGLWESRLSETVGKNVLTYSFLFTYAVALIAVFLYFWPVSVVVGSLFLTGTVYVVLGLGQAKVEGRLFKQVVWEYVLVGIFVFIVMFLFTSWRH